MAAFSMYKQTNNKNVIPTIAIANYGPHSSLEEIIAGIKIELKDKGFIENETVKYEISDAAFDPTLILQMVAKLNGNKPDLIVALTTPVAQLVKSQVRNTPIIFTAVTDPVNSGLLASAIIPESNITGCSEKIDLSLMINFAKSLLPKAKTMGILYSTSEANDAAMLESLKQAAKSHNIEIVAVGIDHQRDIPTRINTFKDKVDFIYVGTSGPIQPALPIIANYALKMNIPVINADRKAAEEDLVLASFGVDYKEIGINTGKIIIRLLKGTKVNEIMSIHPEPAQHRSYISAKNAKLLGISIPDDILNKQKGN